jgi:two-component system, cell cycle sensor histidine kinase and response regulator CckA
MSGSPAAPAPLCLLLVEDSVSDAKLVLREVRKAGHEVDVERVEDPEAMRSALARRSWDVVISDWSMPRFSGLAALRVVKEAGLDVPFIIVSGTVGEELAVEAMRAGAHDYVLKDKLARLTPVIERERREHGRRVALRKSQALLLASEARFSRLTESGIIGVMVADLSGPILEVNDALVEMLGFPRGELVAAPGAGGGERGEVRWQDLPGDDRPAVERQRTIEELGTRGVATPFERTYVRKDGRRMVTLVGAAMLDQTRLVAFMVDLSAQKRAEEALRRSEEQLLQAQKMEAIGRLAGGVAHDFNNLLSVILSRTSILLEELPPRDAIREDLQEIATAGRRGADLTRQLLMFSRQEVMAPKILDLNLAVANLDNLLRRLLGEDVEVVYRRTDVPELVRADPTHIEQVIMNLAVNARDAMPAGGRLTLETRSTTLDEDYARGHLGVPPGPYVMLAASDTGTGMDRETQKRIFEPFFTTKEKGKGTGLGLSTVHGIVERCGGAIWVYSEPGHGTTFRVYLPRVEGQLDAEANGPATVTAAELRGSETILLVEDEEQIRRVAREILLKQGYRVLEARNGVEAIAEGERHPGAIDLLVSDVVMPQMGGAELTERLVRIRPSMKVLCMSGYTDDVMLRLGALQGSIAYLQKPITPQTLAQKVRAVLDSRS